MKILTILLFPCLIFAESIPLSGNPTSILFHGDELYVAQKEMVEVFDPATGKKLKTIPWKGVLALRISKSTIFALTESSDGYFLQTENTRKLIPVPALDFLPYAEGWILRDPFRNLLHYFNETEIVPFSSEKPSLSIPDEFPVSEVFLPGLVSMDANPVFSLLYSFSSRSIFLMLADKISIFSAQSTGTANCSSETLSGDGPFPLYLLPCFFKRGSIVRLNASGDGFFSRRKIFL